MSTITLTKGASPNETRVTIGTLTLYFSYETIVAYTHKNITVFCENVWSSTTGKHLNRIPGNREHNTLPYAAFTESLNRVLDAHNLLAYTAND